AVMAAIWAQTFKDSLIRRELNLGVHQFQEGVEVAAVGGLKRALDALSVLGRHRLFREPGGFEGVLFASVLRHLSDSSVLHPVHPRLANLKFNVAATASKPEASLRNHCFAQVGELCYVEREAAPCFTGPLQRISEAVESSVGGRIRPV